MPYCNYCFAEFCCCQVKSPITKSASPSCKSANLLYSGQIPKTALSASLTANFQKLSLVTESALSARLNRPNCYFATFPSSHRNCIVRQPNSSKLSICYLQVKSLKLHCPPVQLVQNCKFAIFKSSHWNCIVRQSNSSKTANLLYSSPVTETASSASLTRQKLQICYIQVKSLKLHCPPV